jgi:hypothetical protein
MRPVAMLRSAVQLVETLHPRSRNYHHCVPDSRSSTSSR